MESRIDDVLPEIDEEHQVLVRVEELIGWHVDRLRDRLEPQFLDEIKGRLCVVSIPASQSLSEGDTRSIDAEMELLPATSAASSMLERRPLAFADDG